MEVTFASTRFLHFSNPESKSGSFIIVDALEKGHVQMYNAFVVNKNIYIYFYV